MLLVKVPSAMGSQGQNAGARLAPGRIVAGLEGKIRKTRGGFVECVDVTPFNLEKTNNAIYLKARGLLGDACFFLGGDHSITFPLFRAFAKRHKNPALVVFDYHADLGKAESLPTSGTFLRSLIDSGIIGRENVMLLGTNEIKPDEHEYFRKIASISQSEIKKDIRGSMEKISRFLGGFGCAYVSTDIDVFSSRLAPAIPFLAESGLNRNEFFSLFRRILNSKKARALDLVELNPEKDHNGKTIALAQKIVGEALDYDCGA